MKLLEEKIKTDGKIFPGDILKIDNFLNHQIDVNLMLEMGKEFARLYKDEKITKILTIESSGIAIAVVTSQFLNNIPVVFGKKTAAANMGSNVYSSKVYSYTRQREFLVTVSSDYLTSDDKVLIIDDFLANGQALNALLDICKQANSEVVGCGIAVEKAYQAGGKLIRDMGVRVESLAKVSSMTDNSITFTN